MSKSRKLEILSAVDGSGLPISQALSRIDIPSSTFLQMEKEVETTRIGGITG